MAKAKTTRRQPSQNLTPFEEQSERNRTIGENKDFLYYRNKLAIDPNCKHLMLVGGTDKENNAYVEDVKGLHFKRSIPVQCSNRNDKQLREKIYNIMYTYGGADSYKNVMRASTHDMLNKRRDDKRRAIFEFQTGKPGEIKLRNYRLCILNNVSNVNNDLWCELAVVIAREEYRQYILIVTVASNKEADKLPETWRDMFETISLDSKDERKKQSKHRIPDKKFKKLCNVVEKECLRAHGEGVFFRELSKESKSKKYDQTGRGYTPTTAKRRYYEVFPSNRTNQ